MALETGTYISDLNSANPTAGDPKSEGDDHLRLIKTVLRNTFPSLFGAVTLTAAQINAQVPVGTLLDFAGASAPSGFLSCDGSAVSRTTYAGLFAVIGTTWGSGDGFTTFNVPDLRRRTTIGSGGTSVSGPAATVGAVGGEEAHVLTVAELAAHSHGVSQTPHVHADAGHTHLSVDTGNLTHRVGSTGGPNDTWYADNSLGGGSPSTNTGYANIQGANANISIQNNGSGTAHNNMQPSAVVSKIIRT